MSHKIKENHPVVTPFPLSYALHGISQLCKSKFSLSISRGATSWHNLETYFFCRATRAHAGVFLMLSLLLGARIACSFLAVPSVLLLFQSSDPGAALSAPSAEGFCSPLFCRVGFNFGFLGKRGSPEANRLTAASILALTFSHFLFTEISYRKCVLLSHLFPWGGLFWLHSCLSPQISFSTLGFHGALPGAQDQEHHAHRALSLVVSQCPELSLPSPCGHGLCQEHLGWGRLHRHPIPFLYSYMHWILSHLTSICRMQKNTRWNSGVSVQSTGQVSHNSEGIRNLLFFRYSEIT